MHGPSLLPLAVGLPIAIGKPSGSAGAASGFAWQTAFLAPSFTGTDTGWNDDSIRVVFDPGVLTVSDGTKVRLTLEGAGAVGTTFKSIYIGHAVLNGDAYDFDGNQVQVTWGGAASKTIATGQQATSDEIAFALDPTKAVIVSIQCGSTATEAWLREAMVAGVTGYEGTQDEEGTTDVTGYTTYESLKAVAKIEVYAPAMSLSATTFGDDAAAGADIATIRVPAGYTADLIHDCDGKLAVSNGKLTVGTTPSAPGTLRPLLRAKKSGELDITLAPEITVTSVWAPSDIDDLTAAWVSDEGVTVDGSNLVTQWDGAFGTSINMVSGISNPEKVDTGPNGIPAISFNTTLSNYLALSEAIPLNECTVVICWKPKSISGSNRTILGNSLSASNYALGHHSNVFDTNFGTVGAVIPPDGYKIVTSRFQCSIITHTDTGTGATAADGSAFGTGVSCGTTERSVDRFGKTASTNYAHMDVTAVLIYSRVLTATEIERVETWAQQYRTTEHYFASDGSGDGLSSTTPAMNFDTGAGAYRPGDQLLLKGGDYFYAPTMPAITALTTTEARPITIGSYGTGKAHLWGAPASELTWTNSAGDVWTATDTGRTNTPRALWWYRDGVDAPPIHIFNDTVDEDHTFAFSSEEFTIQLESGIDPNDETIVIPNDNQSQSCWGVSRDYVRFRDLDIRHYSGQLWAPQGDANEMIECDLGYTADDGVSPGGSDHKVQFTNIRDCGGARSTSSGPGDGISFHGGGGHVVQYCAIADCKVSGIRNEMGTGITIEGNSIYNCNQAIRALYNADYDFETEWVIRANKITRSADDDETAGFKIDANVTAKQTFTVTDNVFVGQGTVTGKAIDNASANANLTQSGNTQTGFSSLT